MPSLARRLGLGRAAYLLWHLPRGKVAESWRAGGPVEQWRTQRGRAAMEDFAHRLPPLPPAAGTPVELHLLSGRRFWFQTAFCLWTFARHAGRPLLPIVYDDGSLTAAWREPMQRLFPAARFVERDASLATIDSCLPAERFPCLRERWLRYPNIRKLIDPHLGSHGWKLVIDSDLLFFRRPDLLLAWCDAPQCPLHAVDCETAYGYSRPLMDRLAGAATADLVNVGLTGLRSDGLDWDRLEAWTAALQAAEGTSYYLEQALIAMLVAGRVCTVAPAADYVTLPRPPEVENCHAVMHHYVAGSKPWYFRRNWRLSAGFDPIS